MLPRGSKWSVAMEDFFSSISDFSNVIFLFFTTAFVPLLLLVIISRWKKQVDFKVIRGKHGRLQRRLGTMEKSLLGLFMSSHEGGSGNDMTVLFINSKISLEPGLVQKALYLLNQRYPMLRMRVYKNASDGTTWLREMPMDDPSRISFTALANHSAREWIQVFEEESRVSFDLFGGPLWRVTMLQEHYDEQNQQYENSLMFTFHHMICDGASIMTLYSQFLEYMNDLQQGKDIKVESMALLSPCLYLMGPKVQASILERIIFVLLPYLLKVKSVFTKPTKNLLMEVFPPPIIQEPSIVKRTSIIPKMIKSQELSKLIKIGKRHDCTVHGIITAATRLAMAQILQSGSGNRLPNPLPFISSFNVSLRKECQPEVKVNEFGTFISLVEVNVPTPCHSEKVIPEAFWKFAQECNHANRKTVTAKEHYQFLKMFENVDIESAISSMMNPDISNGGRFTGMFNISNRGRFTIGDISKNVAFNFAGTYFAMAEQHIGPPLANNVVSVNGDLYWGLIYFPNITTKELAEQFIELSLSILRDAVLVE